MVELNCEKPQHCVPELRSNGSNSTILSCKLVLVDHKTWFVTDNSLRLNWSRNTFHEESELEFTYKIDFIL